MTTSDRSDDSGVMPLDFETVPEAWLSRLDPSPTILPAWPDTTRLAVVMVRVENGATEAYAIRDAAALGRVSSPLYSMARLFFTVSRNRLVHEFPELTHFWD